MAQVEYLHGFDLKEQKRLIHQAEFLEPYVYAGIDLEFRKNLLEVGCGVGAQSKILLRRFPHLKIDAIDYSAKQLSMAKMHLDDELKAKRIRLYQQDAQKLSMPGKGKYDSAFLCWFLEHVPDPVKVLTKVRSHLKKGSKIYCSEVFNQTFFLDPYSPAYLKYWFEFNDLQWTIKGHPFVGAQLGNLLLKAGFSDIQLEFRPFHFDNRDPEKRKAFIEHFFNIALSAEKSLLLNKRITKKLVKEMKAEVERVKKDKNAVFFDAFVRATATA